MKSTHAGEMIEIRKRRQGHAINDIHCSILVIKMVEEDGIHVIVACARLNEGDSVDRSYPWSLRREGKAKLVLRWRGEL